MVLRAMLLMAEAPPPGSEAAISQEVGKALGYALIAGFLIWLRQRRPSG